MEYFDIKNVQLYWAFLDRKNTQGEYASNKYEVTVWLTPEQAEEVKKLPRSSRQKIKEDNGGYKITLKSTLKPRVTLNATRSIASDDVLKTVGNGTTANVRISLYTAKGQPFLGLGSIVLKDIKEYRANNDSSLYDDEGTSKVSAEDPFDDDDEILD